ncbi:uncharacterized protein LOC136035411 [Artemia franciscana]|uniref:uncharacterized protein LOC136035411 n=1 Tax=Artemia franciscana TaxID=6661 RepID=UPI0032DB3349
MKSQNYHFACVILPLALFSVITFVDSRLTYNSKEYALILRETFDIGPGIFQNVNPTEQKGFWSYNFALEDEQGIMTSSPTGSEEATPRMCTLDTFRLEDDIFLSAYAYFTSGNAEVKLTAVLADIDNILISSKYTFDYLPEQRWLTTNTAISVTNPGNYKVCLEAPGTTDIHSISISELIVYSRLPTLNDG